MIDIFDISDQDEENYRNITYQTDGKFNKSSQSLNNIYVKISNNFNQVVFSNGIEHYILKDRSQDFFPQIKDKIVRYMFDYDDSFYFTTSKEYDRDVDILNSSDVNFNAQIKRALEPGQIKVFDSVIQTDGVNSDKGHMKILMNQGDYFYQDTINIDLCYEKEKRKKAHINSTIDKMYMAYGFNWPYFSYATKFNYILVYNAFN